MVVPVSISVLNEIHRMPEQRSGLVSVEGRRLAVRLAFRLLRTLKDQSEVESAVRNIADGSPSAQVSVLEVDIDRPRVHDGGGK